MRPERRFKPGMDGGLTAAVLVSPPHHLRTAEFLSKRWGPPHGDKRALFLKALEIYVSENVRAMNVELRAPGSPLAAIRSALIHFSERKDLSSTDGCMGINAICEFGMRDEDVTRITRRAANAQRYPLMDTLRRAQMEGELDARTDIESLADFFESTLAGIRIAAKAGKTRPALRRIAEVASGTFADVKSPVL